MATFGLLLSLVGFALAITASIKALEFIKYETGTYNQSWGNGWWFDEKWFETARKEGWLRSGRKRHICFSLIGIASLVIGLYFWDFTIPNEKGRNFIFVLSCAVMIFGAIGKQQEDNYSVFFKTMFLTGIVGALSMLIMRFGQF